MSASNFDIEVLPIVREKYVFSMNNDGILRNNGRVKSNRPKLKKTQEEKFQKKNSKVSSMYRVGCVGLCI